MSTYIRNFGKGTLRRKIESTFSNVVFLATAAVFVGGTIAMLAKSVPGVA